VESETERGAYNLEDYRQWPVPQTAAAPIANHSTLRWKRLQNVPPFAVVAAAPRSRVIAANFAASSVLFCFAATS
jgi:hypothetical protein